MSSAADGNPSTDLLIAAVALIVAGVPFFVGGALVVETDTPPSESPLLGMLSHALWALAAAILAFGVVALLRRIPEQRRGPTGYAAGGVFGLAVLHGLDWVTWAYVDVRGAAEADREAVILDAVVVPFGAGHLLAYAILLGTGVALLGWTLRRSTLVGPVVGWAGVGLGTLTVVLAVGPLVAAVGGGSEGHYVFDAATLLLPVLYLWATGLGVVVYRQR